MKWTLSLAAAALAAAAAPALAQTVWTDWTSATAGSPGSAAGTLDGIGVSYSGQVLSNTAITGAASGTWAPATSFVGGTVDTSPATVGDMITLNGGFTGTATLTFASAVSNPVFAIWSLGQPGFPASFTFDATPVLQVGGPNVNYGGASITVDGNTVSGREGNGVVQFDGSFTSISWTSTSEHYYGFTVGTAGAITPAIPEPETWALMLAGLAAVGLVRRRR